MDRRGKKKGIVGMVIGNFGIEGIVIGMVGKFGTWVQRQGGFVRVGAVGNCRKSLCLLLFS